jgi:hypothetical protein
MPCRRPCLRLVGFLFWSLLVFASPPEASAQIVVNIATEDTGRRVITIDGQPIDANREASIRRRGKRPDSVKVHGLPSALYTCTLGSEGFDTEALADFGAGLSAAQPVLQGIAENAIPFLVATRDTASSSESASLDSTRYQVLNPYSGLLLASSEAEAASLSEQQRRHLEVYGDAHQSAREAEIRFQDAHDDHRVAHANYDAKYDAFEPRYREVRRLADDQTGIPRLYQAAVSSLSILQRGGSQNPDDENLRSLMEGLGCQRDAECPMAALLLDAYDALGETETPEQLLASAAASQKAAELALDRATMARARLVRARSAAEDAYESGAFVQERRDVENALRTLDSTVENLERVRVETGEAQDMVERLRKARADLVELAYTTERLARLVLTNSDTLSCGTAEVSFRRGRTLVVSIAPRGEAEIKRMGLQGEEAVTVKVKPRPFVEPWAGFTFGAALNASYATYVPQATEGGMAPDGSAAPFTVARGGGELQTVNWLVTLGLGLRLSRLFEWEKGDALLVGPEVYLNPLDTAARIGGGMGLSWAMGKVRVRLSGGALWTRHTALASGQSVGGPLANEDALSTRDTYGKPRAFLGFSMGFAPFEF